jgi:hypothetical protein
MAEFNRFPKVVNFRLRELTNFSYLKACLLFILEEFLSFNILVIRGPVGHL